LALEPVIPFEPVTTDDLPTGKSWTAQIKWDGVRMLTYADGQDIRLFNRKRNERTLQYPEYQDFAAYCRAGSAILDGEIIALVDGVPSFHQVMKRDSLRNAAGIGPARNRVPVVYMVFDLLYRDGEWLTGLPLRERQRQLAETVIPGEHVQLVQSFPSPWELFSAAGKLGLEGIVAKDLDSVYTLNGKDGRWRKKKHFKDVVAVVGGVTYRGNIVNALLLGLYDGGGRLHYIGHAGTGKLTVQDWREVTETARRMETPSMPFADPPERMTGARWVKPELTVKVRFLEWTPYGTMRQPSIQAFTTFSPRDCTFDEGARF
jgi:bifunctional non-homologous end joining protein LigD